MLKNERYHKVAQALSHNLKLKLKEKGVNRLVAVMVNNDELIDNLILILDVVNGCTIKLGR